jgi:peroxiredoxin
MCTLHSIIASSQIATISGDIKNFNEGRMAWTLMSMNVFERPTTLTVPLNKTSFHQQVNISEITYISISDGTNYVGGFLEPGDSVSIKYDASARDETINFSGRGHDKFKISNSIDNIRSKAKLEIDLAKRKPLPLDYFFSKMDSIENIELRSLEQTRTLLGSKAYQQLYAYLKATILRTKYNGVIGSFGDSFDQILSKNKEQISEKSKEKMLALFKFDETLAYSPFYANMVQNILSLYLDENAHLQSTALKFSNLSMRLPDSLRQKVLYLAAKKEIQENNNVSLDTIISTSFRSPRDSIFIRHLKQQYVAAHKFKPGMQAPGFSVESLYGDKVSLASLAGKTVYLDFWFAGCAPCHQLFKDITSVKKYFKNDPDVVFLLVSVDEKQTWRRALNKFQIDGFHTFTENKLRNHPIIELYNVSAYPSTFIIDARGKFYSVNPSKNPEILKEQLLSARAQGSTK